MLATRDATEVACAPDAEGATLTRLKGGGWKPPMSCFSDESFGTAAECAADALFVKRLLLIVVPAMLLLCLLMLVLA